MNSSNIFNIRRKNTLVTLMSFLPKRKRLELIRENKRLQKALKVTEVLYKIYSMKNTDTGLDYYLSDYKEDEYTKREILKSLFEISNLPFFNCIGFDLFYNQEINIDKKKLVNHKCHDNIINNIVIMKPMKENQILIGSFSWDNTFKIWDIQNKELLYDFKLELNDIICGIEPIYDIETCKDRYKPILLLVFTWDKLVICYDLRKKEIYLKRNIDSLGKIMYIKKINNLIITSSYEAEISIWDIKDLINKPELESIEKDVNISPKRIAVLKGHKGPIPKLISFDNDKKLISCSWDETIKLWNLENYTFEKTIGNLGNKIINIELLIDKTYLACLMNDGYVKVLNIENNDILFKFEGETFISQLQDGRLITGLHENELQIVNLNTKTKELIYKTSHKSKISGFLQLNDGRLVTCSYDKTIKLHGFVSKKEKAPYAEDFIYSYNNGCLYITYNKNNA